MEQSTVVINAGDRISFSPGAGGLIYYEGQQPRSIAFGAPEIALDLETDFAFMAQRGGNLRLHAWPLWPLGTNFRGLNHGLGPKGFPLMGVICAVDQYHLMWPSKMLEIPLAFGDGDVVYLVFQLPVLPTGIFVSDRQDTCLFTPEIPMQIDRFTAHGLLMLDDTWHCFTVLPVRLYDLNIQITL